MSQWPRETFLEQIGLGHDESYERRPKKTRIAEADIDPQTGGAVAALTEASKNAITVKYWYRAPDGYSRTQNLVEIETVESADSASVELKGLAVLGCPIDVDSTDNVNRVFEAVRQINAELRDGKMPQVAQIFSRTFMEDVIGKKLLINGQSPDGGFSFVPALTDRFNTASQKITVDNIDLARALTGLGVNTLDAEQVLPVLRKVVAADAQTGIPFVAAVEQDNTEKEIALRGSIRPLAGAVPADKQAAGIQTLLNAGWEMDPKGRATLKNLRLLDEDFTDVDALAFMRSLGAANRIAHDMRARRYPKAMDHLTEFDLLGLASPLDPPPPLKDGGRMLVISLFGNNLDEVAEGFGRELGACKLILHEGLDENGKLDRVATIHDFGIFLAKHNTKYTAAAPDIEQWLKYADHIFITHKHLDHAHAISPYAAKELLAGKKIHCTASVKRAVIHQLRKDGVDQKLWPDFEAFEAPIISHEDGRRYREGVFEIEKNGIKRITVEYAVEATPHSARDTPFRYIGRYGDNIIASYLNPGDMRFGRNCTDEWDGPKPDSIFLYKGFFKRGMRGLITREGLSGEQADRQDTYCDYDITSILRHGYAPAESEVEDNLVELYSWFDDMRIVEPRLSTNDGMMETGLRVGTRLGRHMTEVGTNMVEAATAFNVLGVNQHRQEPSLRGNNIQKYQDWFALQQIDKWEKAVQREKRNLKRRKPVPNKAELLKELDQEIKITKAVRAAQLDLMDEPNKLKRLLLQNALEIELSASTGREVRLGSIHVKYNTMTSDEITKGSPPGRCLIAVTGSQGVAAESEATAPKYAEGRSILDRMIRSKGTIFSFTQTPIPGNEKARLELVRALIEKRKIPIIDAAHNGFKLRNLPSHLQRRVMTKIKASGREFTIENDGTIVVMNMPIHASGHGCRRDVQAWLDLIRADVNAPQHTDNPEAIQCFLKMAEKSGLRHPGRIISDFEVLQLDKGRSPAEVRADVICRIPTSIILLRLLRPFRKQYGGYFEGTRVIVHAGSGGERMRALMAGQANTRFEGRFGLADFERARLRQERDEDHVQKPSHTESSPPRRERKYKGFRVIQRPPPVF